MRRLLGIAVVALIATGTFAIAPAQAQNVCVGVGTATTSAPLFHPGFPPVTIVPVTTGFAFGTTLDACALPRGPVAAVGVVTGWCGHSSGQGTTNHGDRFAFVTAGGVMVLNGAMVGVAQVRPDVAGGHSCTTGATRFDVDTAYVQVPCTTSTPVLQHVGVPPTATTTVPTASGGTMLYYTLVCLP